MATHIMWVKSNGSMFAGPLAEKPFIAKHFPLPDPGQCMIIPFTKLRERGINMTDINSVTINSRVTEELETMNEVPNNFHVNCSEGSLIFIGNIEEDKTECTIM
jgi:hypothetical protein